MEGLRQLGTRVQTSPVMPYVDWPGYLAKCEEVAENGYEGFALR